MSQTANIQNASEVINSLERQLHLKQLQINRLLNITQSINNNIDAEGLFAMYKSFLSWEMSITKMALFLRENESDWFCAASLGMTDELLTVNIQDRLQRITKLENLDDEDENDLIKEFEVVIPVAHKDQPLAYVFIGEVGEEEDLYNKVKFITAITNIVGVAIENKRLFKQQSERERMQKEIDFAGEMQRTMIPKSFPKGKGYDLAGIYQPKEGVGGDYFDFVELENDKIAFCIGDVSGKGIAAALLMANFQATFQGLIRGGSQLDDLLRILNTAVLRIAKGDKFITFFIAEYDLRTQKLHYINAGHDPPFLIMNGEVQQLKKGSIFLGTLDDIPHIEIGEIDITNEALILTYTDGLTDVRNEEGEFLDETFGHRFLLDHYKLSAEAFNAELMRAIDNFKGSTGFPDDLTVFTCKIY